MRKIVQIAVVRNANQTVRCSHYIIALANDGTLWKKGPAASQSWEDRKRDGEKSDWEQLPSLPQEEDPRGPF